jgi:hypothetical protein
MHAKYILAGLACTFLLAGIWALASGRRRPEIRTWFLTTVIFGAVSLWLFSRG